MEIDEETNLPKYVEEFVIPSTDELKNLEAWCHLNPIILKAGRCTHAEPEGLADEEKEEYMNKLAEEDKTEEKYKTIFEDSKLNKMDPWISEIKGDTT